eukprot:4821780-Amphidinium_carterae.1
MLEAARLGKDKEKHFQHTCELPVLDVLGLLSSSLRPEPLASCSTTLLAYNALQPGYGSTCAFMLCGI